ncbi:MAG: PAS domain-containing protein [Alphaproteobacteria bacterium]|nr:PAS domain-containing protein [Alphaproteobacteria bacterium]
MPVPDHAHTDIKALYSYWCSVSPEGKLPGRQHIDPVDMAPLLTNLWLIDVHREPLRFWRRLVGTRIEEFAGVNLTGGWIDDNLSDSRTPGVQKGMVEVVETRLPSWRRGKPLISAHKNYAELERLYLPLAEDGETVDMILAMTLFLTMPAPNDIGDDPDSGPLELEDILDS